MKTFFLFLLVMIAPPPAAPVNPSTIIYSQRLKGRPHSKAQPDNAKPAPQAPTKK